jgi:hypothetical protein
MCAYCIELAGVALKANGLIERRQNQIVFETKEMERAMGYVPS